jgi:DNA-binding CsgD family transcriptional regulator
MESLRGDGGVLSDVDVHTFGLIAAGERIPDTSTDSVARLVSLGFVALNSGTGNRPVALNPETAAQRIHGALLTEAAERVAQMRGLHHMSEQLTVKFQQAQPATAGSSQYIDDVAAVNARLDDLLTSADTEILAAQPGGPRTREQLARSVDRDRRALNRGVHLITLYRDSVRQSTAMADHIRMMSGHGAQYRTLVAPYERAIIIDRKHAFVPDYGPDSPPHAAWHITDPAAVGFISAAFMNAWQLARPWTGEPRTADADEHAWEESARGGHPNVDAVSGASGRLRTTPLERVILRDMVDGIQQRTTATRLGISLRALTDHTAVLREKFGATSPAQLGCKFALSPDYQIDDGALLVQGTATGRTSH